MQAFARTVVLPLVFLLPLGCASTKLTEREVYSGERIARPDRIVVHDFAATAADIPAWSEAARRYAGAAGAQSAEEVAAGRELGSQVTAELVEDINAMGLTAVRAEGQPAPREGDIVIVGYFESVDEGSRGKRITLGFGSGAADLRTHVEGYLQTENGPRKLGSGTTDSGGRKLPGVAAPLALAVATANPIGLLVSGAATTYGEVSGKNTIEGAAERTAELISNELRDAFQRQGWI